MPTYEGYIGGDFYFADNDSADISKSIYEEVPSEEIKILKKEDKRSFKTEDILTSKKIEFLRKAILNFIVGASIRRLQQRSKKEFEKKYSFIVHTEQSKSSHSWQESIVICLNESLIKVLEGNGNIFQDLIKDAYNNLLESLKIVSGKIPEFKNVFQEVSTALKKGYLMITKVNSEKQVNDLLDNKGQLKLRTPLNIFIGGQMLDRGITIDNLIGFYYGRQPNKFQQDTVLQHSRMFGNRENDDLAVTRFYTSIVIYEAMRKINEFDNALREAFENEAQDKGVVFIRKDTTNKILPCSPNKILLSTITTLKPHKRMLPIGFQTHYKTRIGKNLKKLDEIIDKIFEGNNSNEPLMIDLILAERIIDDISEMLIFEEGYEWDIAAFKASMEYLSKNSVDSINKGKVWCVIRKDRNISRTRSGTGITNSRFSNVPESEDVLKIARGAAENLPTLILLRQNGKEKDGWVGSPFWWPVLVAPKNIRTVIFASDTVDDVGS